MKTRIRWFYGVLNFAVLASFVCAGTIRITAASERSGDGELVWAEISGYKSRSISLS